MAAWFIVKSNKTGLNLKPKKVESRGHRPKKRLSQNFLQDANIARKITRSIRVPPPVTAIEIGPGTGILTEQLLKCVRQLTAVELDPRLAAELSSRLDSPDKLHVLQTDFLETDLEELFGKAEGSRVLVGNLPYHISTPILFKAFKSANLLQQAVFMVQKEVGERITSPPGNKTYGILSVFARLHAEVEYLFTVPARLFFPVPKVDSAVIRLTFTNRFSGQISNPDLLTRIVRHTFNQRRKMLRNTLSRLFPQSIFSKIGIDLTRRPESLTIEEFIQLANQIDRAQTDEVL